MYENSRFLKNRFTFCGVNTNFGQQWAPWAYYHLTPIVSKGKHWASFVKLIQPKSKFINIYQINSLTPERYVAPFTNMV